jgi:hypothetical protein
MIPATEPIVLMTGKYDGVPLKQEETLYEEGEIGLDVIEGEIGDNLKVLINGDYVATFENKHIDIKVKDGDVVEIDGCSLQNEVEVKIVSKSDNIDQDCDGKKVNISSNIKKLVKIQMRQ